MTYKGFIKQLDHRPNIERLKIITDHLKQSGVEFFIQGYSTGTNLIVDLGEPFDRKRIGVSSHFDRVTNAGGANDNGSAIAVCLDIIKKFTDLKNEGIGLRVFFFDEEETGLHGSTAYVRENGMRDLKGLINMELVGVGDKFALWPVNAQSNGQILKTFEAVAQQNKITARRFDQIVTNTADHLPFRKGGLNDCFTITCISDQDLEAAVHYYRALEYEVDRQTLAEMLLKAPVFEHYHRPSDTFEKISEETLSMTSSIIWGTILNAHGISSPPLS